MFRFLKYIITLGVILGCVYLFWLWLQHNWATVITQTTSSVVTQLQAVQKLETAKMTITKVIEGEQQLADLIPGLGIDDIIHTALFEDKIILEVEGEVTAGYDLENIMTGDITIDSNGTVTLAIGEAQILWVVLTDKTKLFDRKLGLLTKGDINMETQLRNKAGDMMVQDALSGGILQAAKINAQKALQDLLLKADIQIKEVIIVGTNQID